MKNLIQEIQDGIDDSLSIGWEVKIIHGNHFVEDIHDSIEIVWIGIAIVNA